VLCKLHPSKPVTSNAAPKRRRAIRHECLARRLVRRSFSEGGSLHGGGCAGPIIAAICLFGGKTCRALFPVFAPVTAPAGAGWPSLGSFCHAAEFHGPASPGSLRAHPSRHGADAVSCRLLCAPFTNADEVTFHRKPGWKRGLSVEKCCQFREMLAFLHVSATMNTIVFARRTV
jgi:hypothetical protein